MKIDLSGKRAIVTAGAAGIGRTVVETFVEAGGRVAVCDIDGKALERLDRQLPSVHCGAADVSDPAAVKSFFGDAIKRLGGIDILVNNAGVSGPTKAVEDVSDEEWNATLAVNVTGQFYCIRHAVPLMKAQRAGVILNISSTAGRLGMALRAPYSTSKYAVRGLTDVLAVELGEFGIRVNAILPGLVDGERGRRVIGEQAAIAGLSYEDYLPRFLHNVSMHVMIDPAEIAGLAAYLASDYGRHISGQSICVCGNLESYRPPP